jgi:large subunit ribosomal protein L18
MIIRERENQRKRQERRRRRLRKKIAGSVERPRLSVARSLKHVHLQIIDDATGRTLVAVTTAAAEAKGTKTEKARWAGKSIAEKAKAAGIVKIVFDRGGRQYHGRVKAVADAAREAGLEF